MEEKWCLEICVQGMSWFRCREGRKLQRLISVELELQVSYSPFALKSKCQNILNDNQMYSMTLNLIARNPILVQTLICGS